MHAVLRLPVLLLLAAWSVRPGPVQAQEADTLQAAPAAVAEAETETGRAEWAAVGDDTLDVRTARFDTAAIGLLRTDPALDYDRSLRVQELLWERLMRWLQHGLRKVFGTGAGTFIFRHLDIGILAAAAIFLAFFLRKRLFHRAFAPEARPARQVHELPEDPSGLDLDALLAGAEQQQDWRGALRWHYLKALRKLVDEGRIRWQPKSTDRDYLHQLGDPGQRAAFGELSFLFHWAWYGDAPIDAPRYRSLVARFIAFYSPRP